MNTTININDFDKICRICLINKENMIEISTREIIHMLEECTSVQVSNSNLFLNFLVFYFYQKNNYILHELKLLKLKIFISSL